MPFDTIVKQTGADLRRLRMPDYGLACRGFTWDRARAELSWLPGGALNIAYEAVDRHVIGGSGDKLALRWLGKSGEIQDFNYDELYRATNRFANLLRRLGVKRGDVVFTLLGRQPALYISALGTLKAGCVFSPLFSAFGPEPVQARMSRGHGRVLVTT